MQSGQLRFGENYVAEMVEKAHAMSGDIQWHFIGHLQSNKVKQLLTIENLFMVETVDSEKLAVALNKESINHGRPLQLNVMVQVNTSGEESKSGVEPAMASVLASFIATKVGPLSLVFFCNLTAIFYPEFAA
jgi:uncharacterized pyridoxal phosphate-containing UPF0001 family protein